MDHKVPYPGMAGDLSRQFIVLPRQQGAVLLVSLLLLIAITMLTIGSVEQSVFEERMAGGDLNRSLAFEAAEAALRIAENQVEASSWSAADFTDNGRNGLWTPAPDNSALQRWELEEAWSNGNSITVLTADFDLRIGDVNNSYQLNSLPRYMIERLEFLPGNGTIYRITVRSVGGTADAVVMLQSTFAVLE